jgi:hypothetical protein
MMHHFSLVVKAEYLSIASAGCPSPARSKTMPPLEFEESNSTDAYAAHNEYVLLL